MFASHNKINIQVMYNVYKGNGDFEQDYKKNIQGDEGKQFNKWIFLVLNNSIILFLVSCLLSLVSCFLSLCFKILLMQKGINQRHNYFLMRPFDTSGTTQAILNNRKINNAKKKAQSVIHKEYYLRGELKTYDQMLKQFNIDHGDQDKNSKLLLYKLLKNYKPNQEIFPELYEEKNEECELCGRNDLLYVFRVKHNSKENLNIKIGSDCIQQTMMEWFNLYGNSLRRLGEVMEMARLKLNYHSITEYSFQPN